MNEYFLECVGCGRDYPIGMVNTRCACDEPLEVKFNLGSVPCNWFQSQRSGFFAGRYAPFFPYLDPDPLFSLGEGQTSLLRSVSLVEKLGLKELLFKNETQNPTWTFKDRGTACSVQNAIALGYRRFGTLSSGNMGASVAAYGSRAGMDTFIMLKDNVPREKIDALTIYGAKAFQVYGDYGELYARLLEIGNHHQIYFSLSDDPLRIEGYKSLAFELLEQMDGQLPDLLAVPLGSGGLCRGILKGFEELRDSGITSNVPIFIGIQAAGNSPTVDAFEKGADHIECFQNSSTLDHVLENPYPPSGNQVLRKLKASNGLLLKVNNENILTAMQLLSQEGIFAQPASATALAGLIEAVDKKMIPRGSRVVVVVTGSGLKYPPVLKEFDVSPVSVKLDQLPQALEAVLG
ncbi:MAG: threonine synthase [Desulfobacteraceae bacterium]|jgi:threonine synthase|nr:threonine synthase [Desulfobacteraceae bacterium]